MNVLITGLSSFTGYWLSRSLIEARHNVVGTITRGSIGSYSGQSRERLEMSLAQGVQVYPDAPFGSPAFLHLLKSYRWDVICNHGAKVGNHQDPSFDYIDALRANTEGISQVMDEIGGMEDALLVHTSSYFEQNEGGGVGARNNMACSPYGLGKGLTWQTLQYHAVRKNIRLAKYVIPNPIGPYESKGLLPYLVRQWAQGHVGKLTTPYAVRDFIPVNLMSAHYASFIQRAKDTDAKYSDPSGWIETTSAFASRAAVMLKDVLSSACEIENPLSYPKDHSHPDVRRNTETIIGAWSDQAQKNFWQETVQTIARR